MQDAFYVFLAETMAYERTSRRRRSQGAGG
jgi:hypothetical protein